MSESKIPPRKPVTAWSVEPFESSDEAFYVLTFHHGLGKMTRLDFWPEELRELVASITKKLDDNGEKP